VLTVGAVDRKKRLAPFSGSCAGKPDVLAPGVDVVSAQKGGGLAARSGTSMATGHVAGIAALLFQARPEAPIDVVERAIIDSAWMLPCSEAYSLAKPGRLIDPVAALERLRHDS
jgi:subtilisin family serine protease